MRPSTRERYLSITALYLAAESVPSICDSLGVSLPTVRRALAWYAAQRAKLSAEERVSLAINQVKWLKRKAVRRLEQMQKGKKVTSNEIGLLKLLASLDERESTLRGLVREITADPDAISEVDISIKGIVPKEYYRVKDKGTD